MNVHQHFPTLDDLILQIRELRPLSPTTAQVMKLSENDHFSAHELATIISSDQALTAKILRLSNSAYYGFPRRITTVRDAVVLLGFRAVRGATLATCVISSAPGSSHIEYRDFWHFSVSVGMFAELLARSENLHMDEAFTAGVLHNIGLLALDQHAPEALGAAVVHAHEHGLAIQDAELDLLGYTDAELGAALTAHWNFPESLVEAAANYYQDADSMSDQNSVAAYVSRARSFAQSHGLSDGLMSYEPSEQAEAWATPPLSVQLDRAGGVDGLLDRVQAFLEAAVTV